ncbi:MAG: glycosyltransferase [Myxococcales bacterium]|nr:glycosyltransferase [Myxococcales bacterium]
MSPKVCLAISAYKSDAAILRLLEEASRVEDAPWSKVLVVDSLGSGEIPRAIQERGWRERVEYRSFDRNLGSAGNLAERLKIPAEQGFDFVYAINHDGLVAPDTVRRLVEFALGQDRVGAVYPLRRYTKSGNRFDLTGTTRFPLPAIRSRELPTAPFLAVHWGSSNGALYGMAPVRDGLCVWGDFWMGWEDLAYGWLLEEQGYRQFTLPNVILDDDYEYEARELGPFSVFVSDKPSWYWYYLGRNLLLATRRTHRGPRIQVLVGARVLAEAGVTALFRSRKTERLKLLARGILDGLRGVSGKGEVP